MNTILPEIHHYPILWKDGMLVSSKELSASDSAMFDWIRDSRASLLNEFNYGLFPSEHEEPDNYPYFECTNDGSYCVVRLIACRAITKGGYRIEITSNGINKNIPLKAPSLKVSLNEDAVHSIFISVHSFDKFEEAGNELQVTPPGRRFASLCYELSSIKINTQETIPHDGIYAIKIGELVVESGNARINRAYIPPCAIMHSHPILALEYEYILTEMIEIQNLSKKILLKFRSDRKDSTASEILFVVEKLLMFLSSSFTSFKLESRIKAPIHTIAYVFDVAKTFDVTIDCSDYEKYIAKAYPKILQFKIESERFLNSIDRIDQMNIGIIINDIKIYLNELREFLSEVSCEGRIVRGGRR